MAPELSDMTCKSCEEVFTKDELASNDGYCDSCAQGRCRVCRDPLTDEQLEADVLVCETCTEAMESEAPDNGLLTPEEQRALNAYRNRQTYMRNYNQRPDVKVKRKQYNKDRTKREQLLIKKLKASGYIASKNGKSDEERND